MANKAAFIILYILIAVLFVFLWVNSRKTDLYLEVQKVSQLPTGSLCIAALGNPMHALDGEKDFSWYKQFTNLRDEQYLADKKIYLWPGPMFTYIIAVVDKQSDRVAFVTHHHM